MVPELGIPNDLNLLKFVCFFFQHVELEVFPVVSITIIKVADAVVQRVRAFGTTRQAYMTFAVDQWESQ